MKKIIYFIVIFGTGLKSVAQCFPNRHSTNWFDGWVSCEKSQSPIQSYGETHWIMYDLGFEYKLGESRLWNLNEPKNLNNGVSTYKVDYSLDGINWVTLGDYNLFQAEGSTVYQGEEGPDFDGIKARYVLITALNNYGGDCYGFSEIKINALDASLSDNDELPIRGKVSPNPFLDVFELVIPQYNGEIKYQVFNLVGQLLKEGILLDSDTGKYIVNLKDQKLAKGIYILRVNMKSYGSQSFIILKD